MSRFGWIGAGFKRLFSYYVFVNTFPTIISLAWIAYTSTSMADVIARKNVVLLVFGIILSLFLPQLAAQVRETIVQNREAQKESTTEALVQFFSPYPRQEVLACASDATPISRILMNYLAKEKRDIESGYRDLNQQRFYSFSTSRLYEAIVETIEKESCHEVQIIDHDINRWLEIVPHDEGHRRARENMSTASFNYGKTILAHIRNRALDNQLKELRRIFVVSRSEVSPCEEKHKKIAQDPHPAHVLRLIANQEELLAEKLKEKNITASIETRYCIYDDLATNDEVLRNKLLDYKDFVIINSEVCFWEDLTITHRQESFRTKARAYVDRDYIARAKKELFEPLWLEHSRKISCNDCVGCKSLTANNKGTIR